MRAAVLFLAMALGVISTHAAQVGHKVSIEFFEQVGLDSQLDVWEVKNHVCYTFGRALDNVVSSMQWTPVDEDSLESVTMYLYMKERCMEGDSSDDRYTHIDLGTGNHVRDLGDLDNVVSSFKVDWPADGKNTGEHLLLDIPCVAKCQQNPDTYNDVQLFRLRRD